MEGEELMMNYEWKQWDGFKKLHLIKYEDEYSGHFARCGISTFRDYQFIKPSTTEIK